VLIEDDDGNVIPDPVSIGSLHGFYQIRWFNQTAHPVTVTLDYEYDGKSEKGSKVSVVFGSPQSPFPSAVFVIPPGVSVTSGPFRSSIHGHHEYKYSVQTYKAINDPRVIIDN
jgi:hypothetical protein